MQFSDHERKTLLAVKGVGPTIILRLEEMGIYTCAQLQHREAADICSEVAATLGATCWSNSPLARAAIAGAIDAARTHTADPNADNS